MRYALLLLTVGIFTTGCDKKSDESSNAGSGPNLAPGVVNLPGAQGVRKAVVRTVTEAELKSLHTFMYTAYATNGKVPTSQETWAAIQQADRKLVELIQAGVLILIPNPQPEGIWAYPQESLTKGGAVLTQQGVERKTVPEIQQLLQQQ
ncbi:MAG: hypothetical protein R3B84_10495 [Zavarzinella sp.]